MEIRSRSNRGALQQSCNSNGGSHYHSKALFIYAPWPLFRADQFNLMHSLSSLGAHSFKYLPTTSATLARDLQSNHAPHGMTNKFLRLITQFKCRGFLFCQSMVAIRGTTTAVSSNPQLQVGL